MKQCLQIMFVLNVPRTFLQNVIQKKARELGIEGTAQATIDRESAISMVICGQKEVLSDLVDVLHKHYEKKEIDNLQIEPFLKSKDYRGIFRIIE